MVEKLNMMEGLQAKVFMEDRYLRLWGRKYLISLSISQKAFHDTVHNYNTNRDILSKSAIATNRMCNN